MIEYSKLQNGSDIRGIAIQTETHNINLTESCVEYIAHGFVAFLKDRLKKEKFHIAVGTDSRISGPSLKNGVIKGLLALGCEVSDCGMASTPAMFMSTVMDDFSCDGSIMITASHLPFYYNGLKFFTKEGGLEKADIKYILDVAKEESDVEVSTEGVTVQRNLIQSYSNILVEKIRKGANHSNFRKPLTGFQIVVDAGNGAGGFFADQVLKELGADVSNSQFLNPDGMFPNHIPNPENKEAMESISNAVIKHKADLGIIFDTDVDRAAIVDETGAEINKNALIAVISNILLEEYPKTTIVTDSITSTGLANYIEAHGGVHHRFKRGYKNVINESIRLNDSGTDSQLAIETSGHAALKENYFLDDGAYLIAKILIKAAKLSEQGLKISSLLDSFESALESTDYRLKMFTDDFQSYGKSIIEGLESLVQVTDGLELAPNNYEGIRVNVSPELGDGWFLVRLSLHEPLLVMNIESDKEHGVSQIVSMLKEFLSTYERLEQIG